MIYYVGILGGADDVWGVRIPDCRGCHGGGATPEAAISDAISVLREWAAEMRADGVEVPAARTTAEILADRENRPDFAAGESAVLIPLTLDAGRAVRANVTFDAGLLEAIDAEAERRGLTRSAFWPALLARRSRHGIERLHIVGCLQNSFRNCALTGNTGITIDQDRLCSRSNSSLAPTAVIAAPLQFASHIAHHRIAPCRLLEPGGVRLFLMAISLPPGKVSELLDGHRRQAARPAPSPGRRRRSTCERPCVCTEAARDSVDAGRACYPNRRPSAKTGGNASAAIVGRREPTEHRADCSW